MKLTNRLLAVIVALALLILSVLVLIEIVWAFGFGGSAEVLLPYPAVADFLAEQTWTSRPIRTILVGLVVLGVLLIVVEARRSRPGLLALAGSGGSVTSGADRRSLEQATARAATDVEGVDSADARISRRRITVTAEAGVRDTTGLPDRLRTHLQSWLDELELADPPALSVDLNQRRSR